MPGFNGTGTYIRPYNWVNDKNNGINITASRFDTDGNDVATALSTCICKDGQQTTTARIPFAVGLSTNKGSLGTPSIAIIGDTTTGFYQTTSGEIRFGSGGVYAATLNANGLDNTVIGAGTARTGAFSTIAASGQITSTVTTGTSPFVVASTTQVANLNAATAGTATALQNARTIGGTSFDGTANITVATATGGFTVSGGNMTAPAIIPNGSTIPSDGLYLPSTNTSAIADRSLPVMSFTNPASSVNYLAISGAATGNAPTVTSTGTDANINLLLRAKGTNAIYLQTGDASAYNQFQAANVTNSVNWLLASGATTANPAYPSLTAAGSDTNIGINLITKGTGILQVNGSQLATANLSDAVNKGSWTPALKFGGASTGMTYSSQTGTYNRIGNTVIAELDIRLSAVGSSTGAATITGLPFSANNVGFCYAGYYTGTSGITQGFGGYINGTTINIATQGTTGISGLTNSNVTNSLVLIMTCVYIAA